MSYRYSCSNFWHIKCYCTFGLCIVGKYAYFNDYCQAIPHSEWLL